MTTEPTLNSSVNRVILNASHNQIPSPVIRHHYLVKHGSTKFYHAVSENFTLTSLYAHVFTAIEVPSKPLASFPEIDDTFNELIQQGYKCFTVLAYNKDVYLCALHHEHTYQILADKLAKSPVKSKKGRSINV